MYPVSEPEITSEISAESDLTASIAYSNFLCGKCNKEIYDHYRALYKPDQFKENIDKIKNQRKLTMERKWTESEAWIVETLGLDMLVKIDLFDNDLV